MAFGFPFNWRQKRFVRGDSGTVRNVPLSSVVHLQIAAASLPAAGNTGVHAAVTLPATGTTTVTTGITNPAVPRALRIKGSAAGIAGDVVVTGTNAAGAVITETITAVDAGAIDGLKAFKTVTQIVFPARTTAGDTISVGWCDKIGLYHKLLRNTVFVACLDNAREATAPTVASSGTALESNTVLLNTALGSKQLDLYYMLDYL